MFTLVIGFEKRARAIAIRFVTIGTIWGDTGVINDLWIATAHPTSMTAATSSRHAGLGKMGHVQPEPPQLPTTNGHTFVADPRFDATMGHALASAMQAADAHEVPVGAAVIRVTDHDDGFEVLALRGNERERTGDPTAHAEVLALREAAAGLGRWRLDDCLLVVTLEPCPMCAGAAWASRIGGVVFGATNDEAGSTGTLYHLGQDPRLNHEFPTLGGVRAAECAALLQEFFEQRR